MNVSRVLHRMLLAGSDKSRTLHTKNRGLSALFYSQNVLIIDINGNNIHISITALYWVVLVLCHVIARDFFQSLHSISLLLLSTLGVVEQ